VTRVGSGVAGKLINVQRRGVPEGQLFCPFDAAKKAIGSQYRHKMQAEVIREGRGPAI
jgi:hypothetical protein